VKLPPTDPRYVDGAPGGRVPIVSGLNLDTARQRLRDAGFQVADQPTPVNSTASYGVVVGTTPSGQTIPGSIVTINTSNGIAPPPPPPVEREPEGPPPPPGEPPPPPPPNVIEIPGLPPIILPAPEPPPPPPPAEPLPPPVEPPPA
jgi:beta-lactam-binding protein with PASTA domain